MFLFKISPYKKEVDMTSKGGETNPAVYAIIGIVAIGLE